MPNLRIDQFTQTSVVNTDVAPVSAPNNGPSYKATLAAIVRAGLVQPNSASAGAGADLTIKAPDGVTSGAGGSVVLTPGVQASTGGDGFVNLNGNVKTQKTITAAGTTGARTINQPAGSVNFAAAATSLVVTNSMVNTSSVILATVATNDSTMKSVVAVAGSGSFTLTANAAATAETRVNFLVVN